MGLRISVALCTYNGARYLDEQLATIERQTRLPDEVVACDDGSTDATIEILERFAERVPFAVTVHRNPVNLGSTKNFERAISLCSGELICLADQDDAWIPRKLERVEALMRAEPDVLAVFTDAELIDESSSPLGSTLWERLGFTERTQDLFARGEGHRILAIGNVATGATMTLRSELRALVLPIPADWVQDYWIVLLLSTVGKVRPLHEPLMRYRIHGGQQIGVPDTARRLTALDHIVHRAQLRRRMRTNERAIMRTFAESFTKALERLEDHASAFPPRAASMRYLRGKVEHMRFRAEMPNARRRVFVVAREAATGRYHRYSGGWKSAAKDAMLLDRLTETES